MAKVGEVGKRGERLAMARSAKERLEKEMLAKERLVMERQFWLKVEHFKEKVRWTPKRL